MSDAACAKQARVKARACLQLAQEAVGRAEAATPAARNNAACALDTYGAIISASGAATAADFVGQLEALRLGRDTATSDSRARALNKSLARTASSYAEHVPGEAAGPYYAADSAYWTGADSSGVAACSAFGTARDWLEVAGQGGATKDFPPFSGSVRALGVQLERSSALKGCDA
ncbi:hypothetical protein [Mangrovicoccus sp. HB161399]|uniref:hypothetical protein n=1 Tax=Mangrovicoccus sp. HB161399 TaxID=2720392 RepID=UPI001552E303|nr:hypothetical protein [Mangrovicoccus sp. HB161399]